MNAAQHPAEQYYVTAEIKPDGDVEVIRIEATPTLEHAHDRACDHVQFMRRVNQRKPPHGKLETKPLLRALAAWPMPVLLAIAGMRHGVVGQEENDMARGLRLLDGDDDGLIGAVNRCALNEAGDDDRVLLARKNKRGTEMIGPCELVECDKHPGQHELHRWTWDVPEDGDHDAEIACSEPDIVSECPKCAEESEAAWREEIGE